jgi:dephospho-CoA kinase
MKVIGLTGGIACGKSTASATFIANGIPVIDADIVARQVVAPGTAGLRAVINHFGNEFLGPDGQLNRVALGNLVFKDKDYLKQLEELLVPAIALEATIQFNKLDAEGCQLAVWDAATIIENGNSDRYRPLVVVTCPQEIQIKRLMKRNGLTSEQAMDRISSQLPADEKIKVANYVIDSSGTIEDSIRQTETIIKEIKGRLGL